MTAYHTERQVRAALSRIMAAEDSLQARQAHIRNLDALLSLETVATLLGLIDQGRSDLFSFASQVYDTTARENPAWSEARAIMDRLQIENNMVQPERDAPPHLATGEELDRLAERYGILQREPTESDAALRKRTLAAVQPPIPEGVYYNGRFYEYDTNKDMGYDFFMKWNPRATEFPSKP